MKNSLLIILMSALALSVLACSDESSRSARTEADLADIPGQFSYAMGQEAVNLMRQMEAVELNEAAYLLGVQDALDDNQPSRLSQADMQLVKRLVGKKERQVRNAKIQALTRQNRRQQKELIARNKAAPDIQTTASGLQYKVMQAGSGPLPKEKDTVRVHMKVATPSGTMLDSTYRQGQPALVEVRDNLPGYQEALLMMRPGGQYRFWVPYQLAYGEKGNFLEGGRVGPCQMLVLDLTLLEIVQKEAATSAETVN